MKILQVVPYFYPAWSYGGPAKLVYDTSRHFASLGHEVVVYTSDAYDQARRMPRDKRIFAENRVRVTYFRNVSNFLAYRYKFFLTPGIIFSSLRQLRSFDVIHLHDFYTFQNVWVGFLARLYRRPYILSVHGCFEEKRLAQKSFFKNVFFWLFGKKLLHGARSVVATSLSEADSYKRLGIQDRKIVLIGHGVDAAELYTPQTKEEARRHFAVADARIVVTFLGRIHKIKGLDLLVQAIARSTDEGIRWIIAGSDDGYLLQLKNDIAQKGVEKRVVLRGACFGEEKSLLFKATDIFVYPSHSEGFSLGILEAAAAGLPLVITKGCHFDQVGTAGAGVVVDSDAAKLADAVEQYAHDKRAREIASDNARKLIQDFYSVDAIGKRLLDTYGQALTAGDVV